MFLESFEHHLTDLKEVFDRFLAACLKLSTGKCRSAQYWCVLLGYEISKQGIRPSLDRLQAVSEYPVSKTLNSLNDTLSS